MKSFTKNFVLSLILLIGMAFNAKSQSIKLLGEDVANGALTGIALGGATMALQNSNDRGPLRVGAGLGILYGVGTGIYDNSMVSKGGQFYTSGTFNDGKNSTIIVFLDTIYGAAGGAAIGGAVSLIGNEPIIDGLQYGSGAGAWIGFGFGLIDSFVLAQNPNALQASRISKKSTAAPGIVQLTPASQNLSVGFINPSIITQKVIHKNNVQMKSSLAVQIVNMKVAF